MVLAGNVPSLCVVTLTALSAGCARIVIPEYPANDVVTIDTVRIDASMRDVPSIDTVIVDSRLDESPEPPVDAREDPEPPRPIAPLSTARVTSSSPTLRWELPTGTDNAVLEICDDHACTNVTIRVASVASDRWTGSVAPGVHFWRLRGRHGAITGRRWSPTWQFRVPRRDAARNTSWGTVPDFDGDGYVDLAAGVASGTLTIPDSVAVYRGTAMGFAATPSTTIIFGGGYSAMAIQSGGDVNGDGFADLLVSGTSRGAGPDVRVYFGSETGLGSAPVILPQPSAAGTPFFGRCSAAGDLDGDGYGDLVVEEANFRSSEIAVRVYIGSATGPNMFPPGRIPLTGDLPPYADGAIAGIGDVNGDGFGDFAVSAVGSADTDPEVVRVFTGGPTGPIEGIALSRGDGVAGNRFGVGIVSAGDVDGDGFSDAIIGSETGGFVFTGSAMGLRGVPTSSLSSHQRLHTAGGADDVNGDGFDDVVVSDSDGVAIVYFGTSASTFGSSPGATLMFEHVFGSLNRVEILGDVERDGFAEVVAVGYVHAPTAFVYRGFGGGVRTESGFSATAYLLAGAE